MSQRQLFGTDGIRGQANLYPITVEVMLALGRALAHSVHKPGHRGTIVIGKDTRLSGYALEQALAAGVCSMGADVRLLGPLPTPGVAYITRAIKADAGVMISASHNAYHDNGIKIFGGDGFKLADAQELALEKLILEPHFESPLYDQIGKAKRINDATGRYGTHLHEILPLDFDLKGKKIVLDCANGAAYKVAPQVLTELGAEVIILGDRPNGININHQVGSLHPQAAQAMVRQTGASLGIVLDGDADRLVLIDEKGEIVLGDALLALLAVHLKVPTLVCTDMSNLALEKCLAEHGIKVERTNVGDRYVLERLRAGGHTFGGEESGHLIFTNHGTTGDGLAGALMVLSLLQKAQKPLSELKNIFKPMPRAIQNRPVPEKIPFEDLPNSTALMQKIKADLSRNGRLFVRYSGTEKKLRILIEGPEQSEINSMAGQLADTIIGEIQTSLFRHSL
ncbi:MAG: phosphoglucosamine mutase [Myxococcota bacterium]